MSFGIYETVTNRIIAELEAGAIPRTQPWKNQKSGDVMPLNRATGRPYSGINIPILWGAASAFGYPTHQWLTFKQALEMKACVKKGEKGTQVVFTKRRDQKALDAFINAINFYIRPLRFAQVIKAPRTANGDTAPARSTRIKSTRSKLVRR
jgi:antirestriction protein ArdC